MRAKISYFHPQQKTPPLIYAPKSVNAGYIPTGEEETTLLRTVRLLSTKMLREVINSMEGGCQCMGFVTMAHTVTKRWHTRVPKDGLGMKQMRCEKRTVVGVFLFRQFLNTPILVYKFIFRKI